MVDKNKRKIIKEFLKTLRLKDLLELKTVDEVIGYLQHLKKMCHADDEILIDWDYLEDNHWEDYCNISFYRQGLESDVVYQKRISEQTTKDQKMFEKLKEEYGWG